MTYRDIVAVTGLPGLYQLLANKGDGAIVRDLSGGASKFLPARLHRVTPLETIEVYTTGANVRLQQVFQAIQQHEGTETLPDAKADSAALRTYFDAVFPDYDGSRVYDSDLKKMVRWYGVLKGADLLKFEGESAEEATDGDANPAGAASDTDGASTQKLSAETDAARGEEDGLASTTDMPEEGAAQLEEEGKGDQVEDTGLVEKADAGKKPRAKKAAPAADDNGPHVLTASTISAEQRGGAEVSSEEVPAADAPAKKPRSKKALPPTSESGEEAAPKKVARKKSGGEDGAA